MHQITVFNNLSEHNLSPSAHIWYILIRYKMDSTISILVFVYTHRDTQSRATRPCFLVYSKFHVPLCMRTVIWLCVQLTGFVSVQDFQAIQWWWVTFMSEVKSCLSQEDRVRKKERLMPTKCGQLLPEPRFLLLSDPKDWIYRTVQTIGIQLL